MACAALLLLLSAASASPVAPPPAVDCNPAANPPEMCPGSHPCPKCGKPSCPCTGGGPAPAPAPEPAQAVSTLRKRKGEDSSQAVAEPAPETTSLSPPDRRSMQQKIMDPKTVQEINEMRSWTVQFADFVSRTLGGARDVVTVGTIVLALVYYAALVTDSLPDGWV